MMNTTYSKHILYKKMHFHYRNQIFAIMSMYITTLSPTSPHPPVRRTLLYTMIRDKQKQKKIRVSHRTQREEERERASKYFPQICGFSTSREPTNLWKILRCSLSLFFSLCPMTYSDFFLFLFISYHCVQKCSTNWGVGGCGGESRDIHWHYCKYLITIMKMHLFVQNVFTISSVHHFDWCDNRTGLSVVQAVRFVQSM